MFSNSRRLDSLPGSIAPSLDRIIDEKRRLGFDLISFANGDPDLPTPKFIINALADAITDPMTHGYPLAEGEQEFKDAVAEWYKKRFRISVDAKNEVLPIVGSRDGLTNIVRAFVNAGEKVLVPDPACSTYMNATILSDAIPQKVPLLEMDNYLPDLDDIQDGKLLFLNYPNNPTTATIDKKALKTIADQCRSKNIILCYDNTHSEITYDDYVSPSILEVDRNAIEFHSFSKTFSMSGARVGFAAGNSELIAGLKKIKQSLDSGVPKFIQRACIAALKSYSVSSRPEAVTNMLKTYETRRNVLYEGLRNLGFSLEKPKATLYLWVKVNESSYEFARKLIEVGVIASPGSMFGMYGDGYMRFALTQPVERIKIALERMVSIS